MTLRIMDKLSKIFFFFSTTLKGGKKPSEVVTKSKSIFSPLRLGKPIDFLFKQQRHEIISCLCFVSFCKELSLSFFSSFCFSSWFFSCNFLSRSVSSFFSSLCISFSFRSSINSCLVYFSFSF